MTTTAPALPSVFAIVDDAAPDDELNVEQLGSRIVTLSGRLAAATCRWLLLVAQFDANDGAWELGIASTARWLQYACGISHRTAVEHVRIARSLRAWPRLADEMSAGRLSYSHARAISRIASGTGENDPATAELVDSLVETARHGTIAQLEVMVRGLRTINDAESLSPKRRERERISQSWTDGSQWRLSARLDPERGAQVAAALTAIGKSEGLCDADALVRLAEIGLAALADGGKPRELRSDERAANVLHVDAAEVPQLSESAAAQSAPARSRERAHRPFGRIANGPGLPVEVIERLACAGQVRLVVRDGKLWHSDVLDLGRSRRVVTARQFAALMLRDGDTCAHPGCASRNALEAHHVRHWLHGGRTDMDNLILLCKAHHLAHHDGEFTIVPHGRGRFTFLRGGRELPRVVDPSTLATALATHVEDECDVAPDAARPQWDGTRMESGYAVDVVAQHLRVLRSA